MFEVTTPGFGSEVSVYYTPNGRQLSVAFEIEKSTDSIVFLFNPKKIGTRFDFMIHNKSTRPPQNVRISKKNANPKTVYVVLRTMGLKVSRDTVEHLCDEAAQFAHEFLEKKKNDPYDTQSSKGAIEESLSFDHLYYRIMKSLW